MRSQGGNDSNRKEIKNKKIPPVPPDGGWKERSLKDTGYHLNSLLSVKKVNGIGLGQKQNHPDT